MSEVTGLHLDAAPPYVRGKYGVAYDVAPGVVSVDHHLWAIRKNFGPDHPDVDILLDARLVLAAREKATALAKEAQ